MLHQPTDILPDLVNVYQDCLKAERSTNQMILVEDVMCFSP